MCKSSFSCLLALTPSLRNINPTTSFLPSLPPFPLFSPCSFPVCPFLTPYFSLQSLFSLTHPFFTTSFPFLPSSVHSAQSYVSASSLLMMNKMWLYSCHSLLTVCKYKLPSNTWRTFQPLEVPSLHLLSKRWSVALECPWPLLYNTYMVIEAQSEDTQTTHFHLVMLKLTYKD